MKRYYSYPGTGDGDHITIDQVKTQNLGIGWDPSTKVMREHEVGTWVKYDDTKEEFDRGLSQGRKEGQVKVDAMQKAVAGYLDPETVVKRTVDARQDGYDQGIAQGRLDAAQSVAFWPQYTNGVKQDPSDVRTNQLLNELYHDRARLEKVVATAVKLADEAASSAAAILGDKYPEAQLNGFSGEGLTQHAADLIMDAAKLRQFADDNGDKE